MIPRMFGSPMSVKLVSHMMAHLCGGILRRVLQLCTRYQSEEMFGPTTTTCRYDSWTYSCCVVSSSVVLAGSIAATLIKGSLMLIFAEMSLVKCAIWLWVYCKKFSKVQRSIFIIVVSSMPCSFNAIAPLALGKWALLGLGQCHSCPTVFH